MQETGGTLRAPLPPISCLSATQAGPRELAADLIWETNAGLEFTRLSGRLCERLDEPPLRLLDTGSEDGLLKVDGALLQESDLGDIAARRAFRGITCAWPTNEATVHVRVSGAPFVDRNEDFQGYQGVGVDVTLEIERWLRDREHLRNYINGIEAISEGLALFDADDRLVLCNRKYREIHGKLGDIIRYGARFEDIALAAADRGVVHVAAGRGKEWMRERMRRHRNPGPPIEQLLDTGEWVLITERMTKSGGIVSVRTDITET